MAILACSDTTGPEATTGIREFRVKNVAPGDYWPPRVDVWGSWNRVIINEILSLRHRAEECLRLLPNLTRRDSILVLGLETEKVENAQCDSPTTVVSYVIIVGPLPEGFYTLKVRHNRYASDTADQQYVETYGFGLR